MKPGRPQGGTRDPSQREAELGLINSVQTALAARLDRQDICDIVGDKIKEIFDAQVVSIGLLDKANQCFHVPYYIERNARQPAYTMAVYGFRKHVLDTRQALLFNENLEQESINYGNPVMRGELARSAAFIPMINGDEVSGVVTLQHLDLEFAFSDADLTLLKTITNTLSVALENARLFDETQRLLKLSQDRAADLAIVNRVQTLLGNRQRQQNIYEVVGDEIRQIFDAQVVDIALFDKARDQFHFPYTIERQVRFPLAAIPNVGFRRHVIETREALLINHDVEAMGERYGNPHVICGEVAKSVLFVPMIIDEQAVGAISLQNLDREFAFSAADVTFLSTLANSLSGALENARLFDETQSLLKLTEDRANDLEVIGRIGRQFTASLNRDAVFAALDSNLPSLLKASTFFILLMDQPQHTLNMVFGIEGGAPLAPFSLALDDPAAPSARCARQRAEVVQECPPGAQDGPNLSSLYTPLIVGERLLGVMSVQTSEPQAYGERERSIFRTLCSYLAIALDNAAALDAQHAAEAQRAQTLLQANVTLEQLGAIGRDITGNLEEAAVLASLDRHVRGLLDAYSYMIFRLGADGASLNLAFGVTDGEAVAPYCCAIEAGSASARCIGEQREILVGPGGAGAAGGDALPMLSAMYAPLMTGERVLGVMTIQSPWPAAYGEREMAILRTLCAYGAIGLANADALAALRKAQAMIIQQEKMASLGQLVANVAHEINTPIGAVKSSGQNIADALGHMLASLPRLFQLLDLPLQQLFMDLMGHTRDISGMLNTREERALIRELSQWLEAAGVAGARDKAAALVQLRAHRAAQAYLPLLTHAHSDFILETAAGVASIVSSADNINTAVERVAKIVFALKSYSRVDTSGALRAIDLADSLDTVLTIYQNQIKQGVEVVRNYGALGPLLCLPDELNQVWTNLIHNALQAMQNKGTLSVRIERRGDEAVVAIQDSGAGIPAAIRERIFEAFFTTKPAGEGSGLGLDIVKKIVDKHRGRIEVHSMEGAGSTFTVLLPMA